MQYDESGREIDQFDYSSLRTIGFGLGLRTDPPYAVNIKAQNIITLTDRAVELQKLIDGKKAEIRQLESNIADLEAATNQDEGVLNYIDQQNRADAVNKELGKEPDKKARAQRDTKAEETRQNITLSKKQLAEEKQILSIKRQALGLLEADYASAYRISKEKSIARTREQYITAFNEELIKEASEFHEKLIEITELAMSYYQTKGNDPHSQEVKRQASEILKKNREFLRSLGNSIKA